MSESVLAPAHRHLTEAVAELRAGAESGATDDELLSVLILCEGVTRQLDLLAVSTVAVLQRRGTFAERGNKSIAAGLCDLTGWERFETRRRVVAAEQVCKRVGLDGAALPPRLPATADVFESGRAGLRHVEVIAKLLATAAAGRLAPAIWNGAEDELADKATCYTPTELLAYGTRLIEMLDADGAPPDDRDPEPVNELTLRRRLGRAGGTLNATFEDPALFDTIVTLIDAKAKPLGAENNRGTGRRQAEALAEICGYVLGHADCVPECGGFRPHLNVLVSLHDLEDRARAAVLDLGDTLPPESLRLLACDAYVVPIVMNGAGQPLDVGRATRVIPDGLRRAVAARDRGCAFPGCNRPPSWCQVHHIREWEHGGGTKLENVVMLCLAHHRLLHHSGWLVRIAGGFAEFVPPGWIDPDRKPRSRPRPHLIAGT